MKKQRLFASVIVGIIALFTIVPASFAQSVTPDRDVVIASTLHVRSEPWVGNNVIGHLHRNNVVNVVERDQSGQWSRIEFNGGNTAWVATRLLRDEGSHYYYPTQTTPTIHGNTGIVRAAALKVRSTPWVGNNVIGHLYHNDVVAIHGTDRFGRWYQIDFNNGTHAWVSAAYINR